MGQPGRLMFAPSLNLDLEKIKEEENKEGKSRRRAAPRKRTARAKKSADAKK